MNPDQRPSRPRPSLVSRAGAEMDRRRAFLQNFTPAFNIGTQYQSSSTSGLSAVRMTIDPNQEYDEELDEEFDEDDIEFNESELNDGPVELEGVDIAEVEDVEEVPVEDLEEVEDEEIEEDPTMRYDTRFACQDEYMYDDEEVEEEECIEDIEDPMPSTSFGQMHRSGLSQRFSSLPSKANNSGALSWNQAPKSRSGRSGFTEGVDAQEMSHYEGDQHQSDADGDSSEEYAQCIPIPIQPRPHPVISKARVPWSLQPPSLTKYQHQQTIKVKPLISPDICDTGARSVVQNRFVTSEIDELNTDSDSEIEESEKMPANKALLKKANINEGQTGFNRPKIHLSFVHDSSSSPEKKPRLATVEPAEDSNDVDSNDLDLEDDLNDISETPTSSRVRQEIGPRKAGRPRKLLKDPELYDDSSINRESADDSRISTEGTRRTGRTRKPTKQFVINFGGRSRSSTSSGSPRKGFDKQRQQDRQDDNDDDDKRLTMTFKNVGDSITCGRGGGRTRGRPKGSTAKLRTHATACIQNIAQDLLHKTPGTSEANDPSSDQDPEQDVEIESPTKGKGSRGGRRVKTPKPPKENRKISKAKPADILDENAMMGYSRTGDELEDSIDGECLGGGDEDTGLSNGDLTLNSQTNSNSESSSQLKTKKVKTESLLRDAKPVTAETLFDYWWTRDGKSERFVLQEQVSEFLGITSFKRKYPDLRRRVVDVDERDYLLREEKVVTVVQCDLGLTPLYFDDVISILRNDFRPKYLELEKVWMQRLEKKKTETRSVERVPLKVKPEDIRKTLLRSTADWNAALNKDRQANRKRAMDLQTYIINEQTGISKKFILSPEKTKIGYFPGPPLVGQYVDEEQVPKLSSDEMKYLPVNTPVYGPLIDPGYAGDSEDSESDSEESSSTDDTSSSSDDVTCRQEEASSDTDEETSAVENSSARTPLVVGGEGNLGGPEAMNVICKSCNGGIANNKDSIPEMIIHCTKCNVPNHPSCLELSLDMLPYILKYNWQCTDCKNCIECNDPADEDKMLFCDLCDRGYHIYCVGLRKVPTGRWHCRVCAVCYSCGVKTPSGDDRLADWHHEFKKGDKTSKFYLHSQCVNCHKLYKKGQYCPCCLKVHMISGDKSLIECRTCEKWVHPECAKSKPTSGGAMFGFRCDACEAAFKIRTKIRTPFGSCP